MSQRAILSSIGVAVALAAAIVGYRLAARPETDTLLWAADAEGGAPYIFKDPDDPGRNIGFEVDLAQALSRELGRPIEHKQYEFGGLELGLARGDFDFAMNGVEVTPDRQVRLRLSRPYYIYQQQLVVRRDDSRQFGSLDDVARAAGVVGTLENTAAARILDERKIEARLYSGQAEPYTDLELGRIDAVLLDLPIAVSYGLPKRTLRFAGEPFAPGYYAIALRPEDEPLAVQVDAAIGRLVASGELRRIYEKWNIWNAQQEELARFQGPVPLLAEDGAHAAPEDVTAAAREKWKFGNYIGLLLKAARTTVGLSFAGMALAVALGLPIAAARLYGPAPVRFLATCYVEFFRGIPVLLLLIGLYYGLAIIAQEHPSLWWLNLSPIAAAILGFGLNYAAYEAEVYRAGISAVPHGQWEAAASLGLTRWQTFRRIILPQSLRTIIPPMTNDFIALFKDTSLVSTIAVVELTKQYQMLAKSSLKYFEIGLVTAVLYLAMSVPLGYLSRYLEQKWHGGR